MSCQSLPGCFCLRPLTQSKESDKFSVHPRLTARHPPLSKTHLVCQTATLGGVLRVLQWQTIQLSLRHCAFPHVNFISYGREEVRQRGRARGDGNLLLVLLRRKEWLGWMKEDLIWMKQGLTGMPGKPRNLVVCVWEKPWALCREGGKGWERLRQDDYLETMLRMGVCIHSGSHWEERGRCRGNSPIQSPWPLLTPRLVFHLP